MLKRISLLVVLFLSFASLPCLAQTRVAVTPFETDPGLQRYTAYAHGELENLIAGFGNVALVERARMDQMTKELALGAFSGMADPSQVAKFGKMAGASILVTGSLLKVDTERQGFAGFGISTGISKTTATIRVRAYDVEKGTVIYSSTTTGSTSGFRTNFGGAAKADEASAAIEDALKNLGKDENFKTMVAKLDANRPPTGKIKIEIAPAPSNADVEINGVYQGSTPATIEFVTGVTVTIKLTKAGYSAWEKTVAPAPGMRISPELEKKQ
jgi:hypothetical protein